MQAQRNYWIPARFKVRTPPNSPLQEKPGLRQP